MGRDSRKHGILCGVALASTLLLLATALCACANSANRTGSSHGGSEGKPLTATPVALSGIRSINVPEGNHVIRDAEQWREFWSRYATGSAPEIDFETFTLVAVFLGQKPNPGYSVKIVGATEYRSEVVVDVVEYLPSPGMMYAQVIVYPYDAALIPKTGKPIRFASIEKVGHP